MAEAEEEFEEETEQEEEEEEAPRPRARARAASAGRSSRSLLPSLDEAKAWAKRNQVPLIVGGGFLLLYWIGHRASRAQAADARAAFRAPPHHHPPRPAMPTHAFAQSYPTAPDFRTGIQSTSFYDPRFYDYPSEVDAY